MKYAIEPLYRVFDNETGDYIEVRLDADGQGLVEIQPVYLEGPADSSVIIGDRGQARKVADAIYLLCEVREPENDVS